MPYAYETLIKREQQASSSFVAANYGKSAFQLKDNRSGQKVQGKNGYLTDHRPVQRKLRLAGQTAQLQSKIPINDNAGLEKEADVMGTNALQFSSTPNASGFQVKDSLKGSIIQPKTVLKTGILPGVPVAQLGKKKKKKKKGMQRIESERRKRKMGGAFGGEEAPEKKYEKKVKVKEVTGAKAPPFAFRYRKKGDESMDTIQDDEGGFVQEQKGDYKESKSLDYQTSVVAGSKLGNLQKGSKRNITQTAVFKLSPNFAAAKLKLGKGPWEWLHMVAFSIKQTHTGDVSATSFALKRKTGQPQQIRENMVLGTAGTNTAMLSYETMIKDYMKKNKDWKLHLWVLANVEKRLVMKLPVPVGLSIRYHFYFETPNGATAPFILTFNPLNPVGPTMAEYAAVRQRLDAFVAKSQHTVKGMHGVATAGLDKV